MENERDDRMIFLKDLLFAALYQWRKILVFALIFAVLLGGYTGFSEIKKASTPQSEESQQKETQLYQENKARLEQRISNAKNQLESQTQYITDSPVMTLNPYNLYVASATFTVQTDYQIMPGMEYQNPDNTQTILYSYTTHLENSDTLSAVADVINIAPRYVPELMEVYTAEKEEEIRALQVKIRYNNADDAKAMLEAVIERMNTVQSQIAEELGTHQIVLTSSSYKQAVDTAVAETQSTAYERQDTLRDKVKDLQEQLVKLKEPQFGTTASVKKIIIYAVIGGIVGAFLVAGCACVCHIASAKVYSVRTLKNRTGIKVLGCVPSGDKMTKLDIWLRKLEERATRQEQYAIAAANIQNYCADAKNLLVVCDCEADRETALVKALQERGLPTSQCDSLLRSATALEALSKSDYALLVVRCGCSRYTDIERQMETLRDRSNLLGCILVNG